MRAPQQPSDARAAIELPHEIADASATVRHEAWMRMREALQAQIERFNAEREALSVTLRANTTHGTVDRGLEARIQALDARVGAIHRQVAYIDDQIVQTAAGRALESAPAVAETRVQVAPGSQPGFPEELIAIPALFIVCIGLPLAIAYARRIWRRTDAINPGVSREIMDRLNRMDQNIDAIALEVERIGESQRFLTKQTEKERASLKG